MADISPTHRKPLFGQNLESRTLFLKTLSTAVGLGKMFLLVKVDKWQHYMFAVKAVITKKIIL